MDSRKKLIYASIISVCILGSAIVLLWGGGGVPGLPSDEFDPTGIPIHTQNTNTTTTTILQPNPDGTYPAPSIFPANTSLDTTLLESSGYKVLVPYNKLQLNDGDLGRDNPFGDY